MCIAITTTSMPWLTVSWSNTHIQKLGSRSSTAGRRLALTIVGSGKGSIYTFEGELDINLQAGAGNNTLVINEQAATENISNT